MTSQALAFRCPHCGQTMEVEPTVGDRIITCDSCHQPFQLDLPRAQPVPGLIVPPDDEERTGAAPGHNNAEEEETPGKPASEPELAKVRPHMFRRHPLRFLMLLVMVLGGLGGLIYALTINWTVLAIGCGLVALYGGARLLMWWMRYRNTSMSVSSRRCVLRTGLWQVTNVEIPHGDIREVHVRQNWLNRILNVGDLIILGPEKKGTVIRMLGIADVENVASIIRSQEKD